MASVVTRNIELEFIKTKMNVSEAFTPVWAHSGCQHVHVVSNVKGSTHKITRSEGFGLCIGFALCSNFALFVLGGLGVECTERSN